MILRIYWVAENKEEEKELDKVFDRLTNSGFDPLQQEVRGEDPVIVEVRGPYSNHERVLRDLVSEIGEWVSYYS